MPEELTQLRMGKIVKDKYPELDEEDREAVRQRGRRPQPHSDRRRRSPRVAAGVMTRRVRTPRSSTVSESSRWMYATSIST